jgi:hypothetical protein
LAAEVVLQILPQKHARKQLPSNCRAFKFRLVP